ncbi:MAG: DUF3618 domain-containing protein, partial [Candidatus Eremiobacteraeota bacterium]|nr:DUF3618 domain-containing protein [Candidatus Eremiobacteraeota bacterium]
MGKKPDDIRDEIERTRSRIDDTVDAIGYKADVPSRVRDSVNERMQSAGDAVRDGTGNIKDKLLGAAGGVQDAVSSTTSQAASRMSDALDATRSAGQETVRRGLENPFGLAMGAAAMGFLAGLLLPVSDIERERVSPIAG